MVEIRIVCSKGQPLILYSTASKCSGQDYSQYGIKWSPTTPTQFVDAPPSIYLPVRVTARSTGQSHPSSPPIQIYPFLALLRLFLPLPAWHFCLPDPVPSNGILIDTSLFESRQPPAELINLRSTPIWRARDTPLWSLYRIYEAMTARQYPAISSEVEYFWGQVRQSWAVCCIPDPGDRDLIRYAILASIAEELADAFNWRLGLGLRRDRTKNIYRNTLNDELPPFDPEIAPDWTKNVSAIGYHSIQNLSDSLRDSPGLIQNTWVDSSIQCRAIYELRAVNRWLVLRPRKEIKDQLWYGVILRTFSSVR
ncbi:hypothetical protein ABOM_001471 [Aspergillus bombycis]|uniref:Uncharacterized protein n=1 Tax=Aspergillus bombycis TaxID=109264 RepID=A0A1F8ADX6_9EURO|nr:hypothetical protein ABOM_001471 [Aspergillus bombycis]OGM49924.1 hypothetical protein ABOM_001471 [Aspergillus bombycis]